MTDESAVSEAVEQTAVALDGIDGLVHAAGINSVEGIGSLTPASWNAVLDVTCVHSH